MSMREQYINAKLSWIAENTKASIIRELLKSTSIPGMISFGGGVPDPDTFPRHEMAQIAKEVIENEHKVSLQYGTTEGDEILRNEYIKLLEKHDGITGLSSENVIITTGSQQALDLIGRTFLDRDSICAICSPIYLGAASAFKVRDPKFITVPMEEDGPDMNLLQKKIDALSDNELQRLKFIYIVSNFDNPTGISLSLEKRKQLLDYAYSKDLIIIEDDPYGALRFEGEKIPTIYKLAQDDEKYEVNPVLLLNTFSKVLSPGLRMGFTIGDPLMVRRLVMGKQAADLCSSSLTQRLTARYLEKNDPILGMKPTLELYASKRDTMMKAFDEILTQIDGINWTYPHGGLFTWACLPKQYDTGEMLEIAKKNKIIYIPGEAFSVNEESREEVKNCMRISFCLPSRDEIIEGTKRLLKTINEYSEMKGW
ncbi:MAG: PLP-dependent aminotransferase family protein [Thermotogota bacterium]|nr:PLP-dependent aminotransferase family protein [Thermotogota bacterium]